MSLPFRNHCHEKLRTLKKSKSHVPEIRKFIRPGRRSVVYCCKRIPFHFEFETQNSVETHGHTNANLDIFYPASTISSKDKLHKPTSEHQKTIQYAHRRAFQRHGAVECLERIQTQRFFEFVPLQITSKADLMPAHFDLMQWAGLKFIIFNNVWEATKNQSVQRVKISILKSHSQDFGCAPLKQKK